MLSQVKLIAEPWDVGEGGYQVGNFPVLWTEWNGKYRDSVRRFWKGDGGTLSEFATRLAGSSDLYEQSGRRPYASINFITATTASRSHDLVSYNDKHNEANGEDNRDGANDNHSWNCGVEGPDRRPPRPRAARAAEAQLDRDAAALAGRADDLRRRRAGPHAARQQQRLLPGQRAHLAQLGARRRAAATSSSSRAASSASGSEQPVLHRRKFFQGRRIRGADIKDISWFDPSGQEMTDEAWNRRVVRCLGVRLAGDVIDEVDERGEPIVGDTLLLLLNADKEVVPFTLPETTLEERWETLIDTADPWLLSSGCAPAIAISCRRDRWRCCASTAGRKTCGARRTGGRWGCTDSATSDVRLDGSGYGELRARGSRSREPVDVMD